MKLAAILFLLSASIWETKAPADWTDDELVRLFTDSPWAQMVEAPGTKESHGEAVQMYLASAAPMQEAEKERERRYLRKANGPVQEDPMAAEERIWMEDNRAEQIVIAIRIQRAQEFDDSREVRRMEDECVMRVGRRKSKMAGHFPPTAHDPYLRIAFPRQMTESDKSVTFELYVPGARPPFRSAEFRLKDMMWKGKLEL
ncbi:MAG TPA: hypothetical protein VMT15_16550 [Bryobacteraceae bacterium]|nr:hypothetical protein [Bryobacteraceae bacterium]